MHKEEAAAAQTLDQLDRMSLRSLKKSLTEVQKYEGSAFRGWGLHVSGGFINVCAVRWFVNGLATPRCFMGGSEKVMYCHTKMFYGWP